MPDDVPAARTERFSRHSRYGWAQQSSDPITRAGDLLMACVLLAITLPLLLFIGLAVKWDDLGPIFDRQVCLGRDGRRFRIFNFRTVEHGPGAAHPGWAQRPTRLGVFLRRTRIESLPQLINVLRGEMSLIDRHGRSPSFLA